MSSDNSTATGKTALRGASIFVATPRVERETVNNIKDKVGEAKEVVESTVQEAKEEGRRSGEKSAEGRGENEGTERQGYEGRGEGRGGRK